MKCQNLFSGEKNDNNENIPALSCRGHINVKNFRNLAMSNLKAFLQNINAHIKIGENPLRFTQVIVLKVKYRCIAGR